MQNYTFRGLEDDTFAVMTYEGDESVVTIPSVYCGRPVSLVYDDLFKGHKEITEVHLPENLKTLGGFVFDGCENLKSVVLPDTLEDIWQYAFVRSGIEVIEIPGTVERIVPFAFAECRRLRLVVTHKGTKKIYANAFKDCIWLQMVAIQSDCEVSHQAFEGCPLIDADTRVKLTSRCKCPQCTGAKTVDVKSLIKKKQ